MRWRNTTRLMMLARSVSLDDEQPWSIEALAHKVERVTGEVVRFVEVEPSAVSGICGSRKRIGSTNYLYVPASKAGIRGLSHELVAVHELAHVLCGHQALNRTNAEKLLKELRKDWPGVPSSVVESQIDDRQAQLDELDAELLSAMILTAARPPSTFGFITSALRSRRSAAIHGLFGGRC